MRKYKIPTDWELRQKALASKKIQDEKDKNKVFKIEKVKVEL